MTMTPAAAAASLRISRLAHVWLIDVDGTLLAHNGHLGGEERLLPGVREFWAGIPAADTIVLLSAREPGHAEATLALLRDLGLRCDHAIFGLPTGERILVNDRKPSGLDTALAVNLERDEGLASVSIMIDPTL
jgi:hypothetical protein